MTHARNSLEKGKQPLTNAQLIDFSVIRRSSQDLGLGLSHEALIEIARAGLGDGIHAQDPTELAFFRFMGGMDFTDPAISRFLYRKYEIDTETLLSRMDSQIAQEIRLEYRFYGANTLMELRGMLATSDISHVISLTRRNGSEERVIDKATLIRQIEQFLEPFQLADAAF